MSERYFEAVVLQEQLDAAKAERDRLAAELAFEKQKDANAETVRLATLERYEQKDKENQAEIERLKIKLAHYHGLGMIQYFGATS